MRILFISAFYPPHIIGGWDQLVEDINLQLQSRGHVTHVLTSRHGTNQAEGDQSGVSRSLFLESDLYHYHPLDFFIKRARNHRTNIQILKEKIAGFKPDIIFVHGMWILWRGIPWYAEQVLPGRVVYYVADDWPYARNIHENYWRMAANHPLFTALKRKIAVFPLRILAREELKHQLRFQHVLCVSNEVRKNLVQHLGLQPEQLKVVYNGIEIEQFVSQIARTGWQDTGGNLSLLYAGSLTPAKGVHTAIEALHILSRQPAYHGMNLTMVGSGHPDYEAYLKRLVEQYRLSERVVFCGRVPRPVMPEIFRLHDVLLFPSTGEALPRVVQEAMASGLVVIGTTAGGTGEILVDGETGLTFSPGDAAGLANQIERLSQDAKLYRCLLEQGRDLVINQFDIQKTVGAIEAYLHQVSSSTANEYLSTPL